MTATVPRAVDPAARLAAEQAAALLAFGSRARLAGGGFGWLDDRGRVDQAQPVQTWITARMTYVHALAALQGVPG